MLQLREYGLTARSAKLSVHHQNKAERGKNQTLIIVKLDKNSMKDRSCCLITNQALFILEALTLFTQE